LPAQSAALDPLFGRSDAAFECALTTAGAGAAWVRVAGELDLSTAPQLERTLREAQIHFRAVVLDTREVSFIDCSALRVILSANAAAHRGVPPLKLVPGPVVDDLVRLLGVQGQIWSFDLVSSEVAPGEAELRRGRHTETYRFLRLSRSSPGRSLETAPR
jgi:anti-anti-sigma factor